MAEEEGQKKRREICRGSGSKRKGERFAEEEGAEGKERDWQRRRCRRKVERLAEERAEGKEGDWQRRRGRRKGERWAEEVGAEEKEGD